MNNNFSIASWITNAVWSEMFFLTLDYDSTTQELVESDISNLTNKFSLSDAYIYTSKKWFHVFYFYDNRLSAKKITEILWSSSLVDEDFKKLFIELSEAWRGVTIRLNGKYDAQDIFYSKKIDGRKPSYIEKTVWDSLKSVVDEQISSPLIDNKKYKYDVNSIAPWDEVKIPVPVEKNKNTAHKSNNKGVTPKDINDVFDHEDKKQVQSEKIKIQADVLFSDNQEITRERKKWYQGEQKKFIARIISASLQGREWSYIQNREVSQALNIINNFISYDKQSDQFKYEDMMYSKGTYKKQIRETQIKNKNIRDNVLNIVNKEENQYKYIINNFISRRPFFLNNHVSSDILMTWYDYAIKDSGILDTPLNFFKSVASIDIENSVLAEKIQKTSMYNFNNNSNDKISISSLQKFMKENKLELLDAFDLVYDFDTHDGNSTESYDHCKKMRDILNAKQIPFSLNFSGSKWFHIRIPGRLIKEIAPEFIKYIRESETNIKNIFNWLVSFAEKNDILIDKGVYSWDLRCLIRVEWSIHQATWSVVKPLSDDEFDSLEGKTLYKIQEMYKPSNLLNGNKELGVQKLNLQRKDIIVRMHLNGRYYSWKEMIDLDDISEEEWKSFRNEQQNPIQKELRAIATDDPKRFNEIIASGEYRGLQVEAPEYIDLSTWRNYDYCRKGDMNALKEFVLNLI